MAHNSNWIPRRCRHIRIFGVPLVFFFPFCFDRNMCFVWNGASIYLDSLECTMFYLSVLYMNANNSYFIIEYTYQERSIVYNLLELQTTLSVLSWNKKQEWITHQVVSFSGNRTLAPLSYTVIMSCKINNNERVQVKLDFGGIYPLYGVIRTALVILLQG